MLGMTVFGRVGRKLRQGAKATVDGAEPQPRHCNQTNHWSHRTKKKIEKIRKRTKNKLEMWANAQCDGRPAEYRWRPLFNAAKFG